MERRLFKLLVLERGYPSLAALAREAKMAPQTLSDLLAKRRRTRKHQEAIARLLGRSIHEIFDA